MKERAIIVSRCGEREEVEGRARHAVTENFKLDRTVAGVQRDAHVVLYTSARAARPSSLAMAHVTGLAGVSRTVFVYGLLGKSLIVEVLLYYHRTIAGIVKDS